MAESQTLVVLRNKRDEIERAIAKYEKKSKRRGATSRTSTPPFDYSRQPGRADTVPGLRGHAAAV